MASKPYDNRILDYTSAHLIPISQGDVAIYEESQYLIHTVNLTELHDTAFQLSEISSKFSDVPTYRDIIKQQQIEIFHILKTIEIPKIKKRSIDFLGSALKFVAGVPDHEDYMLLLTKQNFLITNNNNQIKINSAFENRINEVTSQLDTLKNAILSKINNKDNKTPYFEAIVNRNNLIINYLNNLVLSITLAKNNLINPLIFDENEMNKIIDLENVKISLSDIIYVSKVKILQNQNSLHYIVKIPKLNQICKYVKIFPVSHNDKIVKLEVNEAAKCESHSFPISQCIQTTTVQVCKPTNATCLNDILNSHSANCHTESSHDLAKVQRPLEGVIILNDVISTKIDNVTVSGTFLVSGAESIIINGTVFKLKEDTINMEAHPPRMVALTYLEHDDRLSLPYLHSIHIANNAKIQTITEEINFNNIIMWVIVAIFGLATILTLASYVAKIFRNRCCAPKRATRVTAREMEEIIENIRREPVEDDLEN